MSNYTLKEGQGSLFKNNRKQTAQHPDYFGNLLVNGKEMRLGAWVIEGKNGKQIFHWLCLADNPQVQVSWYTRVDRSKQVGYVKKDNTQDIL
jgi:hypothetical protein